MSGNLKMFQEIEEKIKFGFKMLTLSVTSGRYVDRLVVAITFISEVVFFFATIFHSASTFNGYITNNIMMSLLVTSGCFMLILKHLSGFSLDFGLIMGLLEWIRSLYQETNDDPNIQLIINRNLRTITDIWKLGYKILSVIVMLGIFAFSLTNFLKGEVGIVMKLPYISSDSRDSLCYLHFMHILQFILLNSAPINIINSDLSLIYLALIIMGAVNIMSEIIDLHLDDIHVHPSFLKIILKRHWDTIRNINQLQKVLFWISFAHFIATTLILLLSFMFLRINADPQIAITLIILILGELFALCLFGQIIQTKMEKLSEKLYLTNWYDLQQKDQKRFFFILEVTQRSYALKAAGMYDISLYTFIRITKMAFSYGALLLTFRN